MDNPSFAQEWGPLIAAGFAALAAIGSVVSAMHAWRTWRDSRRPQLTARLHGGAVPLLRVRNIGGGPAKQIAFRVVIGDQSATSHLPPDGFLAPGQAVSVDLAFPPDAELDDARYVLMCLDRENNTYGWARDDRQRVLKRRRWPKPRVRNITWMFERFYGRGSDTGVFAVPISESRRVS